VSNLWLGDTAQFLVFATDPEDPYQEGCDYELWQRMTPRDEVYVDGLNTLEPEDVAELMAALSSKLRKAGIADYEVWYLPGGRWGTPEEDRELLLSHVEEGVR